LIHCLHQAGYVWHQYSNYCHQNSNLVAVWINMVLLCLIQPLGKLQLTLLGLKMHYIQHLNNMDIMNQLQLKEVFTTILVGPTPAALVT
ncbi:hypothetical protein BJY52DRAFT_1132540, partial [Lactarius psammicola]